MTLSIGLQNYLFKNGLNVELNGERFEVRDKEGNIVCRGATASTAVKKVMWLNACPCQDSKKAGPKRE